MSDRLLKITYNGAPGAAKKINAYLRMPSSNLVILRREIEMFLFQERHLPQTEIRTYWIDADSDEIEIVNQNDYDIFLTKCEKNMHMQIAAAVDEQEKENEKPQPTNVDDPSNFIIHDGVECDSCGVLPMIGFRYKCVQCPNFDLCQSCEAAHKHPDHLMVRMPTNNGPGIIDAYFSSPGSNGHSHRRSGRRFRGQCPFAGAAAAAAAATSAEAKADAPPTTETHKESRRERRHARRGASFVSQFVDAMFNIPQATTTADTAETPAPAAAEEKHPSAEEQNKKPEGTGLPTKTPVVEEPVITATAEEPVAAPRTKEQTKPDETPAAASSTPTTPVINLESLAQMVHPDYMRAGIEILNNFSEMFAKMIDPNEAAAFGSADTSMSSQASAAPKEPKTVPETKSDSESAATSLADSIGSQPTAPAAPTPQAVPEPAKKIELVERRRSDSLDQDWQMIDNTAAPISNVSSTDALINLNATSSTSSATSTSTSTTTSSTSSAAVVPPARDFAQLGEMLRQHVDEEQLQEQERAQSTAHTQTSQVSTVTTSTSTNPVTTNSTSTSTTTDAPAAKPDETYIYHSDERINASVHAMMAMGFSNEGAWLTQLLESVEGNIPAALDLMHTSQSGRQ